LHASIAAAGPLTNEDAVALRAAGLEPIPELTASGVASWFEARDQLKSQVARYRLKGSFLYLAPSEGFTLGDYMLARHLGGRPIQAGGSLPTAASNLASVHAGQILLATLGSHRDRGVAHLLASIRRLERAGLVVSSVQRLAHARDSR
jgi:hypothetical protein